LTTPYAFEAEHIVVAPQFINERFAQIKDLPPQQMVLGHSFEIDLLNAKPLALCDNLRISIRRSLPDSSFQRSASFSIRIKQC
jgi:hypothetical protein